MSYGHVYVGSVALQARSEQTVAAFQEAGSSIASINRTSTSTPWMSVATFAYLQTPSCLCDCTPAHSWSGRTLLQLGVSGGVHSGDDAAKAILSGAHCVQVVSALLEQGPHRLQGIRQELERRLSGLGYTSLAQARGILSLNRAPDPHAWERLNYARLLKGWAPRQSSRSLR